MRYLFFLILPKNHLSALVGFLVNLKLPWGLSLISLKIFCYITGADPSTASRPLKDYSCIGDFFTRDLREGLRPVGRGILSPVDGTLRSFGLIEEFEFEAVKGTRYSVPEFLGSSEFAEKFRGGTFLNFYLAPCDYHQIHSPVDAKISSVTHIPGNLWPVNDWSVRSVKNLFSVNERVVCYLESEFGMIAVVLVGATNVGKISLSFLPIDTNTSRNRKPRDFELDPCPFINSGDRIGTFHMGSSVVVLFRPNALDRFNSKVDQLPRKVCYGETLFESKEFDK